MRDNLYVTEPTLPDLNEYIPMLEEIWASKQLTNNGKFHQELESKLAQYLGVKHVSLFVNGTLALVTALQSLEITGEVITTPYSFVATTHALSWNNIKPVFVDIDPKYCNIDPSKIESAITPNTTAILGVHVYGNPCNVIEIQRIADIYGLKVIYDAAHAFGINYQGQSILNFGNLSVLSFHATKVYHTFEGGAIISHNEKTKTKIDQLKNFGFIDETTVVLPGINSKMNELQAAIGILQLKDYKAQVIKRCRISDYYKKNLGEINGISFPEIFPGTEDYNFAYFPVIIDESKLCISRDHLYSSLQNYNIYGRRYFYPLISQFPTYSDLASAHPDNLPEAENIAKKVICLPIYPGLKQNELEYICNTFHQITNIG